MRIGSRQLGATIAVVAILQFGASGVALGQLAVASQFDPSGISSLCGVAFDSGAGASGEVWAYACSGANVERYSTTGTFLSSVQRAGESANDVDLELANQSFVLAATSIPARSLLFINGETGVADVYAMDRTTGAILSTLNTGFGASHVVGGAYHSGRQTLFLVQDRVPAAADRNRIAEINPQTGAVLNTFQIGATFDVNFGDLEVCNATGNLLVVSSDETRIGEYAPTGALIAYHALPPTVTSLSAIAINEQNGDLWVGSNASSGQISRLTGGPCAATPVPALSGSAPFLLLGLLVTIAGIGRART